jgi:hypothetical protein
VAAHRSHNATTRGGSDRSRRPRIPTLPVLSVDENSCRDVTYNGLANRRLQPLGHVSGGRNPYRSETFASRRKGQIGQNEARIGGSSRIRIRITLSMVRSSKRLVPEPSMEVWWPPTAPNDCRHPKARHPIESSCPICQNTPSVRSISLRRSGLAGGPAVASLGRFYLYDDRYRPDLLITALRSTGIDASVESPRQPSWEPYRNPYAAAAGHVCYSRVRLPRNRSVAQSGSAPGRRFKSCHSDQHL